MEFLTSPLLEATASPSIVLALTYIVLCAISLVVSIQHMSAANKSAQAITTTPEYQYVLSAIHSGEFVYSASKLKRVASAYACRQYLSKHPAKNIIFFIFYIVCFGFIGVILTAALGYFRTYGHEEYETILAQFRAKARNNQAA